MKTKKITCIILITSLLLTFSGCSNSTINSETKDSKVTTPTNIETTTKDEVATPEEITTEEPTTQEIIKEPEVWFFDISESFEEELFIFDYKEDIKKIFDGREFKIGDIIDCREEINKLGYNLNEYGKVFSFIYMRIQLSSEFEILECDDDFVFYPKIDENKNLVFKNDKEGTIKIDIDYDDTSITMTVNFLK